MPLRLCVARIETQEFMLDAPLEADGRTRTGADAMGCLFVVIAMFAPRLAMGILWLLTNWFGRA